MAMQKEREKGSAEAFGSPDGPSRPRVNGNGEVKKESPVIVQARELDLNDELEMQTIVNFWKHDRNRTHFASPPRNIEELKEEASKPQNHYLIFTIEDSEHPMLFPENEKPQRIVGAAMVEDNMATNQNDHWIGQVVVDPERQGQGLGKKILLEAIEWGFGHPTFDRRPRLKLDISVILDNDEIRAVPVKKDDESKVIRISGKEALEKEDQEATWAILKEFQEDRRESVRMIQLADFFDFKHKAIFFGEISVPNKTEPQATARFELSLSYWRGKLKRDRAFRNKIHSLRQAA